MMSVLRRYPDMGFAVLSSNRSCEAEKGGECTPEEQHRQGQINKKNNQQLKGDIKSAGWTYIPVSGGYKEKVGDEEMMEVEEPSYIIPAAQRHTGGTGKSTARDLLGFSIQMCKKYNQDAFLFKPYISEKGVEYMDGEMKGDKIYLVDKSGSVIDSFSKIEIGNMDNEFFTKMGSRSEKRFSFVNEQILRAIGKIVKPS